MQRTSILMAGVIAGLSATSALAAPQRSPAAGASRAARVQLRSTSQGRILVDGSGFTVYRFTRDARNRDTCVGIIECTSIWPPLRTSGRPTAGPGVKASLLSTIALPGGARQVTYAGHPLYLYAPSTERGETAYIGALNFGGTWLAVNAGGGLVR